MHGEDRTILEDLNNLEFTATLARLLMWKRAPGEYRGESIILSWDSDPKRGRTWNLSAWCSERRAWFYLQVNIPPHLIPSDLPQ